MRNSRAYAVAAGLGAVAGLRALTAPAAVALATRAGAWRHPVRFLAAGGTSAALAALAAGELVADKMPGMKNRTDPALLAARAASGAFAGAAVCVASEKCPVLGALLGAGGAVGAAFAGFELRRRAVRSFGIPDAAVAVFEDAVTASAAWALTA